MRILEKADVILLIGANIADNHPILCQYLEANQRKTVIVADPRVSKTAMMADLHLPLKPRSDLALANGIAHILIRHGLIDRDYIAQHTSGFDELERFLDSYTPARVAEITGLSEELLYKTAFLYGRARAGFIGWTMGVNHSTLGAVTVSALCNLALLTGNIGKRRRGAVFDHRPVQRDGDPRSRVLLQHAGLPQVRMCGETGRNWPRCGISMNRGFR